MAIQAYKYNENTDDPIISDGSANFTGIVSATKANRLTETQLAMLTNGDIGAYGTVSARPPANIVGGNLSDDFYVDHNGVAYEDYLGFRFVGLDYIADTQKIAIFKGETTQILFFVDGKLFLANTPEITDWGEPITDSIRSDALISASQLGKKIYFVDEDKLRCFDGETISVIPNFKGISGDTLVDGMAIPPASCIETHVERLCMAGIKDAQHDSGTIFFSDYLDGETWMTTESIQIGADGDEIVGLKSWRNKTLLVFKPNSVWEVICDPLVDSEGQKVSPAFWTVNKISDSYGLVGRETIAQVGNDVWFLSKRGVCSVQRAVAADANEMQALPISQPIQDFIDRINWNAADKSSAVYFKDRYFLSIPIDSSPRPNVVLIYNTITKEWQGIWDGTAMRATGYAKGTFNGIEKLLWRTHDGSAYIFGDDDMSSYSDQCEEYAEYYEQECLSKAYTWDAPLNQKRAFDIEIEFYKSSGVADLAVKLDGKTEIPIAQNLQISTSKKLPLKLPFSLAGRNILNFKFNLRMLPRFREMQVLIRTRNGRATIRNININALVMPV
ncbi:MAG: hypothetical protein J6R08_04995 [Opitutales bacterium]|nr:hypothetical protein [Opitutales bacterium]